MNRLHNINCLGDKPPTHRTRRLRALAFIAVIAIPAIAVSSDRTYADDWPQYAGDAAHHSTAVAAPVDLSAHLWTASQNPSGVSLVFEGPSSPVVHQGRLFANARTFTGTTHVANKLVAIDAATGGVLWETPILKGVLNSWSSPAVDAAHDTVLIGSGHTLYAMHASNGAIAWSTPLSRSIVNASPTVADGLSPGRVFITDFDGGGSAGSLYCINTSSFDAVTNPFQPGEIVWRELLGGTSGNTAAFQDGVVYVASVTDADSPGFPGEGHVFAFDVHAGEGERRLWSTGAGEGFFGGVTLRNGFVYAASYDTFGGQDNSVLVKIRASDGQLAWSTPCERTNSIPIVAGNMIYLSAGIPGFGSVPKLEAFEDLGNNAVKLWDTYNSTAGTLLVGGWTHQPAIAGNVLFCGTIPTGNAFFGAYTDLYLLDLTRNPADPDFIFDHRTGAGSSPAVCGGRVYSIGPAGLAAFGSIGDLCSATAGAAAADGLVNGADVQCFVDALLSGNPSSREIALGDFDGDMQLTVNDVPPFIEQLMMP